MISIDYSSVTFALGVLGVIFSVYLYFKNPQIKAEKIDALLQERMKWSSESVDRRFAEVQKSIQDAFLLAQNHTHTVSTKVDVLNETVAAMGKDIVRLGTIIEERIPKKIT